MTTPNIRAALERLVELDDAASCIADRYTTPWVEWIAAARAALAEPVGEGPSDEELIDWHSDAYCPDVDEGNDEEDSMFQYTSAYLRWLDEHGTQEQQSAHEAKGLRAVFEAGQRYGAQPAAPGPGPGVIEMVRRLHEINRPAAPAAPSERDVSEWINGLPLWHGATRDELTGIVLRAFARWGRPTIPPALPPDYIDPEHQGDDRELLQLFYLACNAEGGTADEIHLRGIRAVLAARPATPPAPEVGEVAELVTMLRDSDRAEYLDVWFTRAATLLQQQESRIADLRAALRECGRAVGSLIQVNCSDAFLLQVPTEVRLAVAAPAPAVVPVAVSERLPETTGKVLAYYVNSLGNGRTICAIWVPAKTRSDSDGEDDFTEYDEETDKFYWPEGWYEAIENWDDLGYVKVDEGEVAYWQPLPKWPAHAIPLPQVETAQP